MAGFDQEKSNALIQALGAKIVQDEKYVGTGWDAISIVYEMVGMQSSFGYYYVGQKWEPATPRDWDILDLASELRDAMRVEGQEPWKKCLVQIRRDTSKIDIDFDYDGDKWVPDMDDPARFALSLRP